jgi:hypothetical protein
MMTNRKNHVLRLLQVCTRYLVTIGLSLLPGRSALAQEFVVDTTVTSQQALWVSQQHLTIFTDERIYDVATDPPGEVTIWDGARKEVLILDTARDKQAVISHDDLLMMSAGIQVRAAKGPPLIQTAAKPNFKVQWDRDRTHLTLSTAPLTYEGDLVVAKTEGHARRYRDFADWSARLNSLRGLPAAARLRLNREIFAHQRLPRQIERRLDWGRGRTETARSQHVYRWSLTDEDREWVAKARQWEAQLQRVAFQQFRLVDAEPSRAASNTQR